MNISLSVQNPLPQTNFWEPSPLFPTRIPTSSVGAGDTVQLLITAEIHG